MRMFDAEWVRPEDIHGDVSPIAIVESDNPIMECATCELPVPMERGGDIYCCKACEDAALDEALLEDAINDAVRKAKQKDADIFATLFPQVVALPEPELFDCSCC